MNLICRIILLPMAMVTATSAAMASDVELLMEADHPTSEEDLVFTVVSGINIEGNAWFYPQNKSIKQSLLLSPVAQWQQRFSEQYLGFLLPTKRNDAGFRWDGKLKVYFGKISDSNRGQTQAWPQSKRKDRSYRQTIASAQSFKQVDAPTKGDTLRFYYAPTNVGWTPPTANHPDGTYEENDSLVILHVDPETGAKKQAIYSPNHLYVLRSDPKNPLDQTMVSIWYTVKAGAIDFSYLEAAEEERGIPVNLYTTQIFVFDDWDEGGYVFGGRDSDPVLQPQATGDDVEFLADIMKRAKGQSVDAADLERAVNKGLELMRSL